MSNHILRFYSSPNESVYRTGKSKVHPQSALHAIKNGQPRVLRKQMKSSRSHRVQGVGRGPFESGSLRIHSEGASRPPAKQGNNFGETMRAGTR